MPRKDGVVMALKAVLESLDGISEELQKEYKEVDGKFILDVEAAGGLELEDVGKLRTALGKERANVKNLTAQIKKFDGIDLDEAKEALSKVQELKDMDPEKKVQEGIKAREKQLRQQHEKEIKAAQDENVSLTKQLEQHLIKAAATKAIAAQEGSVDLLLPHVISFTKMRKNDQGNFIVEVVDAEGNARVGDSEGNPMTIPQLVDEMKASDAFAPAFKGTGSTGTGSPPRAAPSSAHRWRAFRCGSRSASAPSRPSTRRRCSARRRWRAGRRARARRRWKGQSSSPSLLTPVETLVLDAPRLPVEPRALEAAQPLEPATRRTRQLGQQPRDDAGEDHDEDQADLPRHHAALGSSDDEQWKHT